MQIRRNVIIENFNVIVISSCIKGPIVNLGYYSKFDLINTFISVLSVEL